MEEPTRGECLVSGTQDKGVNVAVSNVIDMPSLEACNEVALVELAIPTVEAPKVVEISNEVETPIEASPVVETFQSVSVVHPTTEPLSVTEVCAVEKEMLDKVKDFPTEICNTDNPPVSEAVLAEESETVVVVEENLETPVEDFKSEFPLNSALSEKHAVDNGKISLEENESEILIQDYCLMEEPVLQPTNLNSTYVEGMSSINGNQKVEEVVTAVEDVPIITLTQENSIEVTLQDNVIENMDEDHIIIDENVVIEEEEVELNEDDPEEVEDVKPIEQENSVLASIPCHVLGRNVDNPLEDPVKNGRVLLKPRLGVKIPYRNLTSQIVSKQEITEEIMERSRLRQSSAELPQGGDIFFTKKLTQRLARKLDNESNEKVIKSSVVASSPSSSTLPNTPNKMDLGVSENPVKNVDTSSKIANSDLIALLEGDDDIEWNLEAGKPASPTLAKKNSAEWEREVALKQLRELPKGNSSSHKNVASATKIPKPAPEMKTEPASDDLNIVPRFSSSSVMKTYTRKRKPSGDIQSIISQNKRINSNSSDTKSAEPKPKNIDTKSTASVPKISSETQKSSSSLPKSTKSASVRKPSTDKKESIQTKEVKENKKESAQTKEVKENKKESAQTKEVKENKKEIALTKEVKEKKPLAMSVVLSKKRLSTSEQAVPISEPSPKGAISPNTYISKSSRVVKRKKIWDPDEASPAVKSPPFKTPKLAETFKSGEKASVTPKQSEKKIKVLKLSNDKVKPVAEKVTPQTKVMQEKNQEKVPPKPKDKLPLVQAIKKSPLKKKGGRLSEVDRLLMDEGAVNLLYSVKNTDEVQNLMNKRKKKGMISLDRAQRDLMNKTNEIKNELQLSSTKDSPISLRKKESTPKPSPLKDVTAAIMQRKKSKDSMSGSVHSPPASPSFNYADQADASRIIRRHSSSSFSSESSDDDGDSSYKPPDSTPEKKKKKVKANLEKPTNSVDKQALNREMAKNFNRLSTDDPQYAHYETLSVRKHDNLVQLVLAPTSMSGHLALGPPLMKELEEVLDALQNDESCRVVLVSSDGNSFCQGIDYNQLYLQLPELRRTVAETYANAVKKFLVCLAKFPKVLVAGVHGSTIGLGVTMLPLFDMVLASDTATFSTPYAVLGCPAEGGNLLTLPHIMHNSLASELFFASRKLTAAEGLRQGLVTRTLWPDKFQEEVISVLKVIAGQSLQSMQVIKKQLRHQLLISVETALASETSLLVEHWTSDECQNNFKNYSLKLK